MMHKSIMKFAKYFTKKDKITNQNEIAPPPPATPCKPATNSETIAPPPNIIKKILPLAAFSVAFAIVMTALILYMDNTAMRHHQFRVNMSQDYELFGVSQDNPQLITYIREVHLRPAIEKNHKPLDSHAGGPAADTAYVFKLLNSKQGGVFVESGAYSDGKTSKTEWLEKKANWHGLLIQSDPRHYFSLRRHNRLKSQAVHACLSPMPYPKEVTYHQENEVKINSIIHANSIVDPDPDWFTTRIKCFPLFSLLLAMNVTTIDYLSLESGGTELQVLETIPFDRVSIQVIGVAATDAEVETIKQFLSTKKYTFMQSFNNSTYVFMMNRVKM